MPSLPIQWLPLPYKLRRADRVRKLMETDEFILIHEERRKPNFGRADMPDEGSIRIHYDPVERVFYREDAYQHKPSTWEVAALPPNPDETPDEDEDGD